MELDWNEEERGGQEKGGHAAHVVKPIGERHKQPLFPCYA